MDVENEVAFDGCPGRTLVGGEVVGVGGAAYEQPFRRGKWQFDQIKSEDEAEMHIRGRTRVFWLVLNW